MLRAAAEAFRERLGLSEIGALALAALSRRPSPSAQTRRLLERGATGASDFGSDAIGLWLSALARWFAEEA